MTELLAALADDPTQRRRKLALAIGATAICVAAIAWGALREPEIVEIVEPPPKCQGAAAALAEVWSDQRDAAIRERYGALADDWAPNIGAEVSRQLGAWGRRWTSGRTSACEATEIRGEQSAELMDLRIACYD